MAKKKTKKKKIQARHTITPKEYLETLIKASRRYITNQGTTIDEFFTQQALRLEKELEELKNK